MAKILRGVTGPGCFVLGQDGFNEDECKKSLDQRSHDLCEDNASKDLRSHCENLQNMQGIQIQVTSEHMGTIDNKRSDDTHAE